MNAAYEDVFGTHRPARSTVQAPACRATRGSRSTRSPCSGSPARLLKDLAGRGFGRGGRWFGVQEGEPLHHLPQRREIDCLAARREAGAKHVERLAVADRPVGDRRRRVSGADQDGEDRLERGCPRSRHRSARARRCACRRTRSIPPVGAGCCAGGRPGTTSRHRPGFRLELPDVPPVSGPRPERGSIARDRVPDPEPSSSTVRSALVGGGGASSRAKAVRRAGAADRRPGEGPRDPPCPPDDRPPAGAIQGAHGERRSGAGGAPRGSLAGPAPPAPVSGYDLRSSIRRPRA